MENLTLPNQMDFDFDSGVLCLDFANTVDWHASDHPEDSLPTCADLVAWGVAAGLVTRAEAGELLRRAEHAPDEMAQRFDAAIHLREAIFRIFRNIAVKEPVDQADVDILTTFWQRSAPYIRYTAAGDGIKREWAFPSIDLLRILGPVALSAVDLLERGERDRVGMCADDRGCGWLFYDTSRNRSRRWCSMESCGNRAKAQRHYRRSRLAA